MEIRCLRCHLNQEATQKLKPAPSQWAPQNCSQPCHIPVGRGYHIQRGKAQRTLKTSSLCPQHSPGSAFCTQSRFSERHSSPAWFLSHHQITHQVMLEAPKRPAKESGFPRTTQWRTSAIPCEKEDGPDACYSEGSVRCVPGTVQCDFGVPWVSLELLPEWKGSQ